jgi:hypothetical protein
MGDKSAFHSAPRDAFWKARTEVRECSSPRQNVSIEMNLPDAV